MKFFETKTLLFCILHIYMVKTEESKVLSPALSVASTALDFLCKSTVSLYSALQPDSPEIDKMNFQLMTACRNYTVPMKEADKMLNIPGISRSKRFVFFAPGWHNTFENSTYTKEMAGAFFCRNDVYFVAVDFASYMDTIYNWAAINTEEVGMAIAIGLQKLVKVVPLSNIHLVGHSLGAQIMGTAGRSFKTLTDGRQIPRITGLDPAKPCFDNDPKLGSLERGDAKLVEIIHTNGGVLAIKEPIGDIDFYPGGLTADQPGCKDIGCSHSRALDYFIESIDPQNEQNFPARKCATFEDLESGKCAKTAQKFFMGYKLKPVKLGIFHVNVSSKSPYSPKRKTPTKGKQNCEKQRKRVCPLQ